MSHDAEFTDVGKQKPRCRPFKLIDAMILIGVAALGMAELRHGWKQFYASWSGIDTIPSIEAHLRMVQSSLTLSLLNLAVGYVWIRLIPPCLPGPDLVRQPGMLVLILLLACALLYMALTAVVKTGPSMNMVVGVALALSWVAACFHFRSIAEPGWIEGFGRLVAISLILAVATSYS